MEILKIFLFFVTCGATSGSDTRYSTTSKPANTDRTNSAYITTEYSDGSANFIEYSDDNTTFIEYSYPVGNNTYQNGSILDIISSTTNTYPNGSVLEIISNSNITKPMIYNLTSHLNFTRTSRRPFYNGTKTTRTTTWNFSNRTWTRTPYTRENNTSYTKTISWNRNTTRSNISNSGTTPITTITINLKKTSVTETTGTKYDLYSSVNCYVLFSLINCLKAVTVVE